MEKTLEQLKAEQEEASKRLQEAQEALRKQEREAAEALRKAKELAERKERLAAKKVQNAKFLEALKDIKARMVAGGYPANKITITDRFNEEDFVSGKISGSPFPTISFDAGRYHSVQASFDTIYSSGWRTRVSNYRIEVGDYANRRRYPARKDGSYNTEKIVEVLLDNWHMEIRKAASESKKENLKSLNIHLAEELKKEFGEESSYRPGDYNVYISNCSGLHITPSQYNEGKVKVEFDFSKEMTKEEAAELLAFLQKINPKSK